MANRSRERPRWQRTKRKDDDRFWPRGWRWCWPAAVGTVEASTTATTTAFRPGRRGRWFSGRRELRRIRLDNGRAVGATSPSREFRPVRPSWAWTSGPPTERSTAWEHRAALHDRRDDGRRDAGGHGDPRGGPRGRIGFDFQPGAGSHPDRYRAGPELPGQPERRSGDHRHGPHLRRRPSSAGTTPQVSAASYEQRGGCGQHHAVRPRWQPERLVGARRRGRQSVAQRRRC